MKRPQFLRQRSFSSVHQQITEEKQLKEKLQVELKLSESRLSSISDSLKRLEQYKETSNDKLQRAIAEMNQQYKFVMEKLDHIHANRLELLKTFITTLNKEIERQLSRLQNLSSNGTKYKVDIEKLLNSPTSDDYKKECKELLSNEGQLSSKWHNLKDITITSFHVFSLPRPSIHDQLFTNIENDIRGYLYGEGEAQVNRNVSLFTATHLFPMFTFFIATKMTFHSQMRH